MNHSEIMLKARDMVQHDKAYHPYTVQHFMQAINNADSTILSVFIGELLIHEPPSTGLKIAHEYWLNRAMADIKWGRDGNK